MWREVMGYGFMVSGGRRADEVQQGRGVGMGNVGGRGALGCARADQGAMGVAVNGSSCVVEGLRLWCE